MTSTHAAAVCNRSRPCGSRSGSDNRCARHTDLPDHVVRLQRCGPCRVTVRAAGVRQHLHADQQPDPSGARGAHRGARGWVSAASPSRQDTPRSSSTFHTLLEPGDEFVAARQLYGGSINQFNHSFKKFDWHVVWADAQIRSPLPRRHPEDEGDLLREHRQSRRHRRRPAGDRRDRQAGAVYPSSSTIRSRRPTSAGQRSSAPTSSFTA